MPNPGLNKKNLGSKKVTAAPRCHIHVQGERKNNCRVGVGEG